MAFLGGRVSVITRYFVECARHGMPEFAGPLDRRVVFLVDGVGRFQAGVLMVRRVLREQDSQTGSFLYDWQTPIYGEVLTDLMWYRRNRVMGVKLARKLLAFRRDHPDTRIDVFAYSGGAGIAVFACEYLAGRGLIDTLILACPAISPGYNLAPALAAVERGYALISHRDSVILGCGTRLLGTTDRRFTAAGGKVGFRLPDGLREEQRRTYERLGQIRWTAELRELGHAGGHVGWAALPLLRRHLLPLLAGEPLLPVDPVDGQ